MRAFDDAASVTVRNNDVGLVHLDQSATAALLQLRQDRVGLLAGLDELDLDGQMIGDLQDVG